MLLDEPFSGLDAALRAETREAVLHALAQQGSTALLVTHDQAEALSMGREVAVLRDGHLVQRADPGTLYRAPIDADVASFVGEAILLAGEAHGDRVTCELGDLALRSQMHGRVQVMVRPEQVRIARTRHATNGASATLSARVTGRTFYGPDTLLTLALTGHDAVTVKARTFEHDVPEPGELVDLFVAGPVAAFPSAALGAEPRPAAINR